VINGLSAGAASYFLISMLPAFSWNYFTLGQVPQRLTSENCGA